MSSCTDDDLQRAGLLAPPDKQNESAGQATRFNRDALRVETYRPYAFIGAYRVEKCDVTRLEEHPLRDRQTISHESVFDWRFKEFITLNLAASIEIDG